MPVERKLAFGQGAAAASLLWTGVDGSLSRAFESMIELPDGPFGDALALAVVLAWGSLALAITWRGFTSRPFFRRPAPPRRSRSAPRRRNGPARRRSGPSPA